MNDLSKDEIKDINKNLLDYNLEILPLILETPDLNDLKKLSYSNQLNESLTFTLIPRITIEQHIGIGQDKLINEITSIFRQIREIEKQYDINSIEIIEAAAPYSNQLPDLYKQLDKPIWVLVSGNQGSILEDFLNSMQPFKFQNSIKPKFKN